MKKVLFLHGFFASGSCVPATALREALLTRSPAALGIARASSALPSFARTLQGEAEVLSPDLPLHPKAALAFVKDLCERERPDVLVGNSCGSFLAQMLVQELGVPALLGNPHFEMTRFLCERMGTHQYKSPRKDGRQEFTIDQPLIDEFAELEAVQFSHVAPELKGRVWGLFGEHDTLAHYEPQFLQHYTKAFHFPGAHTPTAEEVKGWYAPLIKQLLEQKNGNCLARCHWCNGSNPRYVAYHDTVWGRPEHDDRRLFAMLLPETFQAGLSWECLLNKMEAFRTAFDNFDPQKIAEYDEAKVDALMQDKGIIRNRRKIEAAIVNARVFMDIQRECGTFDRYIWGFTEGKTIRETGKTASPLSDTIAGDLRRRGMKFIGSTTVYAYLQAIGVINAHEPQCWCYKNERQ